MSTLNLKLIINFRDFSSSSLLNRPFDDWGDQFDSFPQLQREAYPDNGGPYDTDGNVMTPYRQKLESLNSRFNQSWLNPLDDSHCNTFKERFFMENLKNLHKMKVE